MSNKISFLVSTALAMTAFSLTGCNSSNLTAPSISDEQTKKEAKEHEMVEFTLVNDTNSVITEFYVSAPDEEEWGDNLFASNESLEPGESTKVTIDDGREDCKYDISATFAGSKDGAVGEG